MSSRESERREALSDTVLADRVLARGSDLGGYRILDVIGQGGTGVVYKAEKLGLRYPQPLALKVLRAEHVESRRVRGRFERESQVMATLATQRIVTVYETGTDRRTGLPFIAMELLRGENIEERLARKGPLQTSEAIHWLREAALALGVVHAHQVVHRDVKPSNLFVVELPDGSERLKLLDFGIAKQLDPKNRTTEAVGTPGYRPPEQLEGKGLDHRTDLFALAHTAHALLTGRPKWQKAAKAPSPEDAALPPGFEQWFAHATAPSLDQRFAGRSPATAATELIEGLAKVLRLPAFRVEPGQSSWGAGRKSLGVMALALLVGVAAGVAALLLR